MNKIKMLKAAGAVAAIAALASSPAVATEGYFSHGYGAVNKSLAGAGVATGFDAMSQATNPAALTSVDPQFTVDFSVFSPNRESTLRGTAPPLVNGTHTSDNNYFLIPSLAGVYEIDAVSSWGWAIYGNGGMNTTYPAIGPFGSTGKTGVDLAQLFIQGTYARDVGGGVTLGIGPIFAAQRFKAYGLGAFAGFSSDPTKLSNNGYEWSYGLGGRLGLQWEIIPALRFGASYQSRTYMTEFDKYKGLFAEQGDFDIPPALQAGFSWETAPGLTLLADWKRIWYSDVESVGNPFAFPPPFLGDDGGPGYGWEDIDAFKFGVQWQTTPTIALRAGFGINDNPIPSSEVLLNVTAPGVQEQHYTAGLTWQANPNNAFNFGAMYSPSNSVTGPDPLGSGGTIEIEMYQWELTAGWTRTF